MGEGEGGGENNAQFFIRKDHRRSLKKRRMDAIRFRILYGWIDM